MATGFMAKSLKWLGGAGILCLFGLASGVWAGASVTVNGLLGDKALISINGGPAKVMRVGESRQGVKLIGVQGDQVLIEEAGQRRSVGIGLGSGGGGAAGASQAKVVLTADGRGQFTALGDINGASIRFLVDTGASVVVLPASVAKRAGVALENAPWTMVSTANGAAKARRVLINTIRVGGVSANLVEALVLEDGQLSVALLGMSFLNRTNMRREGDQLTLTQRY